MQKSAVALVVLFLASSLIAQPTNPRRQVVISNLTLTGVTHLSTVDLQSITTAVQGRCCVRYQNEEIKQLIRDAFEERGYFKATVEQIDVTPLTQVGSEQAVPVSASVIEGQQYRLKDISFSGGKTFPNDQLRHLFAIANGDIFNTEKIRVGLEDLRRLYSSQGYINITPVPNTEANDATATISLLIDLDEGKQFHFGRLVLGGDEIPPATGARLSEAWNPYEGKPYDAKLVEQYWQSIQMMLPFGLTQEKTLAMKLDPQSATVYPRIAFVDTK